MKGLVNWFINNPIAANLLMLAMIFGGWSGFNKIEKEPFPTNEINRINVSMVYPGAAPSEVEQQIVIRVEEAVADLPGIFQITSQSSEGFGSVGIEVIDGFDVQELLNEVKGKVDAINTFPRSAERPIVEQFKYRNALLWFAMWGDVDMKTMKDVAYQIRDEMTLLDGISEVAINGMRQDEVSIEISEENLRRYQLTFSEVANAIRSSSLNVPAGTIKTRQGDIQIQTRSQAYTGEDFSNIVIRSNRDGSELKLSDVADIKDGLSEQNLDFTIQNKKGFNFEVKMSDQPDLFGGTANAKKYLEELKENLPEGLDLKINFESKEMFDGRFNLLKDNAISGLFLVFVILMLFLRPALAFWVVAGIATTFAGAMWLLPLSGITINMLSMFAFLMVLGIVVDDAIIVGESIYDEQQKGEKGHKASELGTKKVFKPVVLAVMSTVIFFLPMIDVPTEVEPYSLSVFYVVAFCLLFSLIEALLVLPSHLSHLKPEKPAKFFLFKGLQQIRKVFSDGLEFIARKVYQPALKTLLHYKWTTVVGFITVFAVFVSLIPNGHVKQVFFPNVPSFFIMVDVDFPDGSPYQYSIDLTEHMQTQARKLDTDESLLALNEGNPFIREVSATMSGNHINMFVGLVQPELRTIGLEPVVERLKELIGPLPEAKSYSLTSSMGNNAAAIELNLRMLSNQVNEQNEAVADVIKVLSAYPEVNNARSNLDTGRLEVELALKPYAETMGITMAEIATQVRQSFYGEEVQRIPRSKEDVKVMLRYPLEQRSSLDTLDQLRIRTQQGVEIPLESIADVSLVPGSSSIRRTERQRNIKITADITEGADSNQIITKMLEDYLPQWKQQYIGFNLSPDGNLKAQSQFGDSFLINFGLALLLSLAIFAIAFKSLFEPFLVVLAVPFGFMGAILGHLILGIDISLFSFMGFLACSGVVVNDNLVLLERLNHLREKGMSAFDAALNAGADRFRAIILTSLTTFMGLMPILFETSFQAQFLIPMVTSLAFGVAVSSLVTLILVPAAYFAGYSFGNKITNSYQWLKGKVTPNNKDADLAVD